MRTIAVGEELSKGIDLTFRHAVGDAGHGEDVCRVARVVSELAPESLSEAADRPLCWQVPWVPDPLEQVAVGQHPAGANRKLEEQFLLGRDQ